MNKLNETTEEINNELNKTNEKKKTKTLNEEKKTKTLNEEKKTRTKKKTKNLNEEKKTKNLNGEKKTNQLNSILNTKLTTNNLNECCFCHKKLKLYYLIGYPIVEKHDFKFDYGFMYCKYQKIIPDVINYDECLKFCDIICAKFYDMNISNIVINSDMYREMYINEQLTKKKKIIYEKCASKDFKMLPKFIIKDFDKMDSKKIEHLKTNYLSMVK